MYAVKCHKLQSCQKNAMIFTFRANEKKYFPARYSYLLALVQNDNNNIIIILNFKFLKEKAVKK